MVCVQTSPAAASSTLLSGYGGPGQGNQAILGATLVGGGGKSGGSGGSSSSSSSSYLAPTSIALPVAAARARGRSAHSGGGRGGHSPAGSPQKGVAGSSKGASPAYTHVSDTSSRTAGAGALGLSGADLAYMLLAFLVLALTAVLTVLLTRRTRGAGEPR